MKYIQRHLLNIKSHNYYDKAIYWTRNISITTIAQIAVQGLGFISGILIIRLLSVEEYALYTLANTMLGTMSVLGDGGISTGVMSQGGKVWQDPKKLGAVLATGLHLRKRFAIFSLIVALPILVYLLLHGGANWGTTLLIVLSIIPAFYAALSDSLLEIIPKLHQSILPLQKNQVGVAMGRLLLTASTILIFPWTFVAILAGGIPRLYGNKKLKKITHEFIDPDQLPDPEVKKEILIIVKRVLPGAIYFSISGQITIWLVSVFGNVTSIAQLGAIGRLAMLLGLFTTVFSTLLIPRFARLKDNSKLLMKRFLAILSLLILVFIGIILLFLLFSEQILWLLGEKYLHLNLELILYLVGSCIGILTGIIFTMGSSRGWILNPYIYITASIISIVLGIIIFDISTLVGILFFNILINTVQTLIYLIYTLIKIKKVNL